jgi:hypothetical protein
MHRLASIITYFVAAAFYRPGQRCVSSVCPIEMLELASGRTMARLAPLCDSAITVAVDPCILGSYLLCERNPESCSRVRRE